MRRFAADESVAAPNFLVMAPLPANDGRLIGNAMAFAAFARSFGQALGAVRPTLSTRLTLQVFSGVILQDELLKRLPSAVLDRFQGNSAIAFALIPSISGLGDLAPAVREAFAGAIRVTVIVAIPLSALAFFLSLFAKSYSLATAIEDTTFGMEERSRPASAV